MKLTTKRIFRSIGLSSITIIKFIDEINRQFHLNLRETVVFDHVNINDLSKFILIGLNSKKCENNDFSLQTSKRYPRGQPIRSDDP